jgi:predicted permease
VSVLKDLLFALRMIRRAPGFALVAILTLGIGIGANTAIFSLIDTIFLHGLPFAHGNELVLIQGDAPERSLSALPLSITKFEHIRDHQTSMTAVAADFGSAFTITGMGDPVQVPGEQMSSDYFALLGVTPIRGRLFLPEEDAHGDHVAILSEDAWTRRFARDPAAVGRVITLNGVPHAIVGIVPTQPVAYFGNTEIYTTRPEEFPGITPELRARGLSFLRVVGRLRPGISRETAQEEMNSLMVGYKADNAAKADSTWNGTVLDLQQNTIGRQIQSTLWLLLGAVALVLLIATSNVANLLLVRFSARRRDISVRLSLGANRARVTRLFVFESFIISLLAALIGLAIGRIGLTLLIHLKAPLPIGQTVSLSPLVIAFTMTVALATGLMMGLYPSIQAARTDVVEGLKESSRSATLSRGQHWFRMVLLGGQVALSSVLLIGALLLTSTVAHLLRVNPGFHTESVFDAGINLPASRYPTKVEQAAFERQLLEGVRHAPGVLDATLGIGLPLSRFGGLQSPYSRSDGHVVPYNERPLAPTRFVASNYFTTLGIPIIEGRQFTDHDRLDTSIVTIISQSAARKIYPEGGALGKHLLVGSVNQGQDAEIVGICGDVHSQGLQRDPPDVEIYRVLDQQSGNAGFWELAIRTSMQDPTAVTGAARDILRRVDSDVPLIQPAAMTDIVQQSIGQQTLLMTLLALFAAFAMLLAVVGTYGVLAYIVSHRRNEIGVRLALGAQPGDVIGMVFRQGMVPVFAGLAVGVGGAVALGRVLQTLLFPPTEFDPVSFAVAIAGILVAGLAACWLPSWRASRIGPSIALKG